MRNRFKFRDTLLDNVTTVITHLDSMEPECETVEELIGFCGAKATVYAELEGVLINYATMESN